jgi:hypothetical protein
VNKKTVSIFCFLLAFIIATGLFSGCTGPEPEPVPSTPPEQPSETPGTPQAMEPQETANEVDKVEVYYFHRPQRCTKCLCFEERVTYVVENYFPEEIANGKMSFKVIDLADAQEAETIRKYNAVASQLFINTIIDGSDNIRDVQEIWSWDCTSDPEAFDEAIRFLINRSLRGELE